MSLKCIALLVAFFPQAEPDRKYPRAELLLEPAYLSKNIGVLGTKKPVVILDARPKKEYEAGHIPGAYWVDAEKWAKTFASSQEAKTWEPLLAEVSVSPNKRIVIYDNARFKDAARIWWILHYWGIQDAHLLNGGWKGWESGQYSISKETPPKPEKVALDLKPQSNLHATRETVLDQLKSKTAQIIDARSEGEYCGDVKLAKKAGSIPGAKHLEWSEAIDPRTHRFKSAGELEKLLKDKGIDLNQPAITYCQSGGRAAVLAFTLELMGAKNVSNYYRGWAEWGNAEDTPVATPKK